MESLQISKSDCHKIITHLEALRPIEGCGLMGGTAGAVKRIYQVANRVKSPIAYEMDPAEQLAALLEIEELGMELIGIYHSHPSGPPSPSATDIEKNYYPEAVQVIVSWSEQQEPVVRAFRINEGELTEIPIQIN